MTRSHSLSPSGSPIVLAAHQVIGRVAGSRALTSGDSMSDSRSPMHTWRVSGGARACSAMRL